MTSSSLNPSQHVERIREILIGRDLHNVHGRLDRIEGVLLKEPSHDEASSTNASASNFREEQISMREEIETLKQQSSQTSASNDSPVQPDPQLTSAMTAQIDARFREIFSHFQGEILKMKVQLDEELNALKLGKIDRTEVNSRFARMATAALEEQDLSEEMKNEGFLL